MPEALPALPGPDGVLRCPWGASGPADYRSYHDGEWGRPVRDERGLYERISLEAFQAGLSWLTVLRKREALRGAFAGFDPERVAGYGDADVERLLLDPGLVRSRAKITATVRNARSVLDLRDGGGLPELVAAVLAQHPDDVDPRRRAVPVTTADVAAATPASTALARALKGEGLVFVGPVTAQALLQACGYVDDHLRDCAWRGSGPRPDPRPRRRPALRRARRPGPRRLTGADGEPPGGDAGAPRCSADRGRLPPTSPAVG